LSDHVGYVGGRGRTALIICVMLSDVKHLYIYLVLVVLNVITEHLAVVRLRAANVEAHVTVTVDSQNHSP